MNGYQYHELGTNHDLLSLPKHRSTLTDEQNSYIATICKSVDPTHEAVRSRENHLLDLKCSLYYPIFFQTDLSGDWKILLHGLVARGLISTDDKGVPCLTERGRSTNIVLGGDLNDRSTGFVDLLRAVSWLRCEGALVHILLGNHELFLISFLLQPLPKTVPDWAKKKMKKPLGTELTISDPQLTAIGELRTWINVNGGADTIRSLASLSKADPDYKSADTDEEIKFRRALTPDPITRSNPCYIISKQNERESWLLLRDAWRAMQTPLLKQYLELCQPFVKIDSVIFVHAFFPDLKKPLDLRALYSKVKEDLSSPHGAWEMMFGYSYMTLKPDGNSTWQTARSDNYKLFEHRVPAYNDRRSGWINKFAANLAPLYEQGIKVVLRGHDPCRLFDSVGPIVDKDFNSDNRCPFVVHADTEKKDYPNTSYVHIDTSGVVTSYCETTFN